MAVILFGRETCFKARQARIALPPSDVTSEDIVIDLSTVQFWKAAPSILVILNGVETVFKAPQSSKQPDPIVVLLEGIVADSSEPQFWN